MNPPTWCYNCIHRQDHLGECHISCRWPWALHTARPELKRWKGCGVFPLLFDMCIIQSCPAFREKKGATDESQAGLGD